MKRIYLIICYAVVFMMMFTTCSQEPWIHKGEVGTKEPFLRLVVAANNPTGKIYLRSNLTGFSTWEQAGTVFVITNVSNSLKWTVTPSADWMKIHRPEQDFFVIWLNVGDTNNSTTTDRTGSVTVTVAGMTATIEVIHQRISTFSFSGDVTKVGGFNTISFDAEQVQVTKRALVTLNQTPGVPVPVNWNAKLEEGVDWLKINRPVATGNEQQVVVTQLYYSDGTAPTRSAFVYFEADGALKDSVKVIQTASKNDDLSVDKATLQFASDKLDPLTVAINTTAASWDAKLAAGCDWLKLEKAGKELKITPVSLFYGPGEDRSTEITVSGGTAIPVKIKVTQNKSEEEDDSNRILGP